MTTSDTPTCNYARTLGAKLDQLRETPPPKPPAETGRPDTYGNWRHFRHLQKTEPAA